MEKKHTRKIREKYSDVISSKPTICLHIPDDFLFMDAILIGLLENSFKDIVSELDI